MNMTSPFPFEPTIRVGLCENSSFGLCPQGDYQIEPSDNQVVYLPLNEDSAMTVKEIAIGRGFHWEQRLDLKFRGVIRLTRDGDNSLLLNLVKAEEYLRSVVGSEMNPDAPEELVKAHAIISRSWLMRQLRKVNKNTDSGKCRTPNTIIDWTEADAHTGFDVCPDDHCQRYQGIDAITEASAKAVDSTRGIVLIDAESGEIADARFSKCCGGRTELFSSCWGNENPAYLQSVADPFCHPSRLNSHDKSHLLNDYDSLTDDYYQWERIVPRSLVRLNLKNQHGIDIGDIQSLIPIEKGPSDRIIRLLIKGSQGEIAIGKELTIRRLLSDSHLYSSAFEINESAEGFILHGRGWGHGVGLCQIGAAVMASEGYKCEEILNYYYPSTKLCKLYE